MNSNWNAFNAEAETAAEHLAIGATAIGRANFASQALYAQAFFALSIGLERASKLALIVEHLLANAGNYPDGKTVRDYGHDLGGLLERADVIAEKMNLDGQRARLPRGSISDAIVHVLSEFATNITRYYNIDFLTGTQKAADSPTKAWFENVVARVADRHCSKRQKERYRANALAIRERGGNIFSVIHVNESGDGISTVEDASYRAALTEATAPWVRMYVLQFARFFGALLSGLSLDALRNGLRDVPELSEHFALFFNNDQYFRSRKRWSMYDI